MTLNSFHSARTHYLQTLQNRYTTIVLPIPTIQYSVPLYTIFQPLTLRYDPSQPVRKAADDALSAILSIEQGMEDE